MFASRLLETPKHVTVRVHRPEDAAGRPFGGRPRRSNGVVDLSCIYYGSFWSRVRMFCGIVLACATIAVLACCRIWALDRADVAEA